MPPKKNQPKNETSSKSELHKVLLHNDDKTTMAFVIFVLKSVFHKSNDAATETMMEVHNSGVAVAGEYELDVAQAKVTAVKVLSKVEGCPLRCTVDGEIPEHKTKTSQSVIPKGWLMAGSEPDDYNAGFDTEIFHSGSKCAFVENAVVTPKGFGTLMQLFSPKDYLEKRLRMIMWVKSDKVEGRIQPWLRIDGPSRDALLGFDNACNRAMTGTNDWKKYDLVLDVPKETKNIAFGIIISGTGKAWIDDISFDEVGEEVPTTECNCFSPRKSSKSGPRNLDFEE